jgi:hypothetical protein
MFKNKNRNKYSTAAVNFFLTISSECTGLRRAVNFLGGTVTIYALVDVRLDDYREEWSSYRFVLLQITELSTLPGKVIVYTTEEYLAMDGCEFRNIFDQIH